MALSIFSVLTMVVALPNTSISVGMLMSGLADLTLAVKKVSEDFGRGKEEHQWDLNI